jgi:glycosyltransferase involved in cell wall biosynthesis
VVHCAYPRAGELIVESARHRALVAALPLAGTASPAEPNPALTDALVVAARGTRADVVHVHAPALGPAALANALEQTGIRSLVTLHEHALVCENYALLELGERYCGIPDDLRRCDRCIEKTLRRTSGAVQEWRSAARALVSLTDAFVVPSESVLEHAARLYPEVRTRAKRIAWGVPAPSARSTATAREGRLRVAVVGVLLTVKGRHRLPSLLAAARGLDVEWHLFGATEGDALRDVRRATSRVVVHGSYRRGALGRKLVQSGCHIALLPTVGAESFSLTLSEIAAAGIPTVASHLGALGERIASEGLGWTFDPWDGAGFTGLLSRLEHDRNEIDRVAEHVRGLERRTEEQMVSECAAIWSEVARLPHRAASGGFSDARERFAVAEHRAASLRLGALGRAVERFRKTDFYRDLSLRQLLSVTTRKRLENAAMRIATFKGRQ